MSVRSGVRSFGRTGSGLTFFLGVTFFIQGAAAVFAQPISLLPPEFEWIRSIGVSKNYAGQDVAVDPIGNTFATGFFETEGAVTVSFGTTNLAARGRDIFLVKYDPAGTLLWARVAGGFNSDEGTAVAADRDGNAFLAGTFSVSALGLEFGNGVTLPNPTLFATAPFMFLAKFNAQGLPQLAVAFGGAGSRPTSVAVDKDRNIVVAGNLGPGESRFGANTVTNFNAFGGFADVFVAKFNPLGANLWVRTGRGDDNQYANAVAVDTAGNVLVTGRYFRQVDFSGTTLTNSGTMNLFVTKYSPDGNLLWARRGGGPGGATVGWDLAADAAGNAYVAVSTTGGIATFGTLQHTNFSFFNQPATNTVAALKLDPAGNFAWIKSPPGQFTGDLAGDVLKSSIGVDTNGYVFVAGARTIAKLENGGLLWWRPVPGANSDAPGRIAVNANGSMGMLGLFRDEAIFVPGQLAVSSTDSFGNSKSDIYVAKLADKLTLAVPAFVTQPPDLKGVLNQTTNLVALASGAPGPSYQWYFNGGKLVRPAFGAFAYAGETSYRLWLNSFQANLAGDYFVVASNAAGIVTSRVAKVSLDVPPPAGLSLQVFGSTNAQVGQLLQFAATFSSSVPGTVQWLRDGAPVPGQTNQLLSFLSLRLADAGEYKFVACNAGGCSTSAPVRLAVTPSTFGIGVTNNLGGQISTLLALDAGRLLVAANDKVVRLNADGSFDFDFKFGSASGVYVAARQADGKILLGGDFVTYDDGAGPQNRAGVVRLNADGSLDAAFQPKLTQARIRGLAPLADGKVFLGGEFQQPGSFTQFQAGRLNADGSIDTAYPLTSGLFGGSVFPVVQTVGIGVDGRVYLGGGMTSAGGMTLVSGITRYSAAGAFDATWRPAVPGWVASMAVQADGGIVIGGSFNGVVGTKPLQNLGRLKSDASLDPAFVGMCNSSVDRILVQPDGKVIAAGAFFQYGGVATGPIVRVNTDGTRDTTFTNDLPANGTARVFHIALGTDGALWAAGFQPATFGGTAYFLKRYAGVGSGSTPTPTPSKVPLSGLRFTPNGLSFSLPAVTGLNFIIETKASLGDQTWRLFQNITGTAASQTVVVPVAGASGFVRVRPETPRPATP